MPEMYGECGECGKCEVCVCVAPPFAPPTVCANDSAICDAAPQQHMHDRTARALHTNSSQPLRIGSPKNFRIKYQLLP